VYKYEQLFTAQEVERFCAPPPKVRFTRSLRGQEFASQAFTIQIRISLSRSTRPKSIKIHQHLPQARHNASRPRCSDPLENDLKITKHARHTCTHRLLVLARLLVSLLKVFRFTRTTTRWGIIRTTPPQHKMQRPFPRFPTTRSVQSSSSSANIERDNISFTKKRCFSSCPG
jgi:hypothetical protein